MSEETPEAATAEHGQVESTEAQTEETATETPEVDWHDKWSAQQKVNKDLERKFAAAVKETERLKNGDRPAEEQALEDARSQAREEATNAANVKLAKSALKLAAKGVLADPADALAFIDSSSFDVDDNGDVDSDALNEAIKELLVRKPHLAAAPVNRFKGGSDSGANRQPQPTATAQELAAAAFASGDVRGSIAYKLSQLNPLPVV